MDDLQKGIKIVVRRPNGTEEELTAHCEKVLIGSGAHCEVRLPVEYASVEHVEVSISNGRIYARARSFDPAPTMGGSPFVQSFVEPGVELGIGPLRIIASLAEDVGASPKEKAQKNSSNARLIAFAAIAVLLLIIATAAKPGGGTLAAGGSPPPLWTTAPATCPQSSPPQAAILAEEKRRVAEGKRERRPFHVQDGVAAVPLFELASACYAVGGDDAMATAMRQSGTELRTKVLEDYHAHQVRLEHALGVKDTATARHEIHALKAFTDGLTGPYVTWLANLDRSLKPTKGA